MAKTIRILEVPILCLIMAFGCMQEGAIGAAIFLSIISLIRFISIGMKKELAKIIVVQKRS